MKTLKFVSGFALIIICYFTGEIISVLIDGFISPAVTGMLVLFIFLKLGIIKRTWIEEISNMLLDNLVFFFIPATAGVVLIPLAIIKKDALAIVVASVVSTFLVLWIVGYLANKFDSKNGRKNII